MKHDTYTFILESLFKISTSRTKDMIYAIFLMNSRPKSILDSMNMKNVFTFYDHYHLKKLNLENNYYQNRRN